MGGLRRLEESVGHDEGFVDSQSRNGDSSVSNNLPVELSGFRKSEYSVLTEIHPRVKFEQRYTFLSKKLKIHGSLFNQLPYIIKSIDVN